MKMTKSQVVKHCREIFKDYSSIYHNDSIVKREYFNDYIDSLRRDGAITENQYMSWINPF